MGEVIFHSRFRHRRSHLKSKTVDTLLKIISLCADDDQEESQISSPIVSGVRRNYSENELMKDENVELVLGESKKLSIMNDISVDDYSIENENLVTENVNLVMNDISVDDYSIENENLVTENVNCALENNLLSDANVEPLQGNVDEIKVVDEQVTDEIREPIRTTEDMQMQSSSSEQNVVNGVGSECQQEKMGLTEPVNLDTSICCLTDMGIGDGQIPNGLGLYNEFVGLIHEGLAQNEEKSGGEDHTYYEVIKEREIENEHQEDTGAEEKYMSLTCIQEEIQMKTNDGKLDRDYALGVCSRNLKRGYGDDLLQGAGNSGKENDEANVDAITKKVCLSDTNVKRGYGDDRLQEVGNSGRENSKAKAAAATKEVGLCNRKLERGYEDDWLRDARTSGKGNGDAEVTETTKKNTIVGEKRSRVLGKERKAKKKMNERKKRAQTRKEQGVKKLRIEPPISKPKAPKYCEFYLKGRCQKGDSCKFSHDITPLTKSQPCKFLALQQCLKGDDCPFDHQLSKYPCNNYASKGSCYRGDKCLFSHKIVETPTPSDVSPTGVVSQPSPNILIMKRNLNTKNIAPCTLNNISGGEKTPSSTGTQVHKNPEQSVLGKLRPPAQPPKGVTLISFGKTPPSNSSNKKNYNDAEAWTQKDQESLKTPQSSNEQFQETTLSTPSSASQYSQNPLQNVQNKNSAQRAPSSTVAFAAKYESEMMKNRSKIPTATSTNSSKTLSSTASSSMDNIQNRLLKASPLLQEFLFGFGGTDGKL
ncbi:hypothetical protein MKW92_029297 [Papaver armeniacum]|nr:hypothetical protein MKW92_029297 [Papaver armeniacum]